MALDFSIVVGWILCLVDCCSRGLRYTAPAVASAVLAGIWGLQCFLQLYFKLGELEARFRRAAMSRPGPDGHGGEATLILDDAATPGQEDDDQTSRRPTRRTPHTCDYCGAADVRRRCAGCNLARYCGEACQRQGWIIGGHKADCRARRAASAAATG
jgi:hypothetical protein